MFDNLGIEWAATLPWGLLAKAILSILLLPFGQEPA